MASIYRNNLIKSLEEYRVRFPNESKVIDRITDFVQTTPNCFERSNTEGHLTGSAWLVNHKGEVLLTHHKKLKMWIQLGGHADGNPSILDVALNEAREESGIDRIAPLTEKIFDVDVHLIPENKKEKAHYHYDIRYLLSSGSYTEFSLSKESISLAWLQPDQIQSYTEEVSILRMRDKYINYLSRNQN